MSIVDEALVKLGFVADTEEAEKYGKSLDTVKRGIGGVARVATYSITAFVAANQALQAFVVSASSMTDELGKSAKELGVNVEWLSKWSTISKLAGDDASSLISDIDKLSSSLTAMQNGLDVDSNFLEGLARLDLNIQDFDDANELFLAINKNLQGLDPTTQKALIEELGLSSSRTLSLTNDELQKYGKNIEQIGVTTKKEAANAARIQDAYVKLKHTLSQVAEQLYSVYTPAIENSIDSISNFYIENKKLLTDMIDGLSSASGVIMESIGSVLGSLITNFHKLIDLLSGNEISEPLKSILGTVTSIFNSFMSVLGVIIDLIDKTGALELMFKGLDAVLKGIDYIFKNLVDWFEKIAESDFIKAYTKSVEFINKHVFGDGSKNTATDTNQLSNKVNYNNSKSDMTTANNSSSEVNITNNFSSTSGTTQAQAREQSNIITDQIKNKTDKSQLA